MPIYQYVCECGNSKRVLAASDPKTVVCTNCDLKMARKQGAPSAQAVETIDTGWMPKSVTRYANAEELSRDHTKRKR